MDTFWRGTMLKNDLKILIQRLRSQPGLERLLRQFEEKYHSYGSFGIVEISNPSKMESDALLGLMGRKVRVENHKITVKAAIFEQAIQKSGYAVDLQSLLEAYFQKPLITKREIKEQREEKRIKTIRGWLNSYPAAFPQSLLKAMLENQIEVSTLNQVYKQEESRFENQFPLILEAVSLFPCELPMSIAVLASKVVKDPHAFDRGMLLGDWFIDTLISIRNLEVGRNDRRSHLSRAEDLTELYRYFDLFKDDLNNKVTIMGIKAWIKGNPCLKLLGAYEMRSFLDLSLRDINKFETCSLIDSTRLFVVENPTVFSAILDRFEGKPVIPSVMCTYGQPKLSAIVLLDQLVRSGCEIWYSGDYDPEGVLMADRLAKRYSTLFVPWRYQSDDYKKSIPKMGLTQRRLRQLSLVEDSRLKEVAEVIQQKKKAGYQEEMMKDLIQDIESFLYDATR